jgi:hypothetical protein
MSKFEYRTLTQSELRSKQRECEVIKTNKMVCGFKAKMRVSDHHGNYDSCMNHFVAALQIAKKTIPDKIINLDSYLNAQEVQLKRAEIEAANVKAERKPGV